VDGDALVRNLRLAGGPQIGRRCALDVEVVVDPDGRGVAGLPRVDDQHRPARADGDLRGAEPGRATLGFLEYLRTSVASKVEDAPEPDVRTPGVDSGTNLMGLVNHLAHVEPSVFLGEHVARRPATFHATDDQSVAEVVADYREAVARANGVIAAEADLAGPPGVRRLDRRRRRCGGR